MTPRTMTPRTMTSRTLARQQTAPRTAAPALAAPRAMPLRMMTPRTMTSRVCARQQAALRTAAPMRAPPRAVPRACSRRGGRGGAARDCRSRCPHRSGRPGFRGRPGRPGQCRRRCHPRPGFLLSPRTGRCLLACRRRFLYCVARSRASGQSPVRLPGARVRLRALRAARELVVCARWCRVARYGGPRYQARCLFLSLCRGPAGRRRNVLRRGPARACGTRGPGRAGRGRRCGSGLHAERSLR